MARREKLPGWATDNDASVRADVAPLVGATMAAGCDVAWRGPKCW